MLVGRPGCRARQLRSCLAVWLAALLVVAPFVRPSLPVQLTTAAAASQTLVAEGDQSKQPAAALLPVQPATLGILSRLSLVETALGPPPAKPPLLRLATEQPVPVRGAAIAHRGAPRAVFERSSVGTARTPTGPPA